MKHLESVPAYAGSKRRLLPLIFGLLDSFALVDVDELLAACSRIPVLVLSLGNALLDEGQVQELVARHRHVHRILSVSYRHYGAIATEAKNAQNREFLVSGLR